MCLVVVRGVPTTVSPAGKYAHGPLMVGLSSSNSSFSVSIEAISSYGKTYGKKFQDGKETQLNATSKQL